MSRNFGHDYEDGTPFWRIFGAVLLALVVYGLLQLLVASMMAKSAARELQRQIDTMPAPSSAVPASSSAHVVDRSGGLPLPSLPGPIRANAQGLSQACVNGRVTRRLPAGWEQGSALCVAYSD